MGIKQSFGHPLINPNKVFTVDSVIANPGGQFSGKILCPKKRFPASVLTAAFDAKDVQRNHKLDHVYVIRAWLDF